MSRCRVAGSRALSLDLLNLSSRSYSRRITRIIPRTGHLPPAAKPASCALRNPAFSHQRTFHSASVQRQEATSENLIEILPVSCPGCGAFSQTIEPDEPGYYGATRKQTRKLLQEEQKKQNVSNDNAEVSHDYDETSLGSQSPPSALHDGNLPIEHTTQSNYDPSPQSLPLPHICDRCHDLIHHNKAVSTPKPSIESIREYLDETPYKNNRIYHIIDAADFPMSLVPRIHSALRAQDQRSHNRRAANEKYSRGKKLPTISFIITRSDLLAATKEQVDSKMEYVRGVLREALGKAGRDVRLGNVHMISAKRGWWTKQVKDELLEHGGGIWVVGKANVGKSNFIEACFPKDSRSLANMEEWIDMQKQDIEITRQRNLSLNPNSLLPPAPNEGAFPVLPVVSSLPGTTVSPIRIPFGRGWGEVIDLPGLERSELDQFVQDDHKLDLIMTKRIKPDNITIKPGQSLLLGGGLVRLTAVNPNDTVLAACFVPIETHVTKTEKAIEIQSEQRSYPGKAIMKEGTGSVISSAGKVDLKWDVTTSHLPSSVAKAVKDHGAPIPKLPYRVMAADILIEGCGWVEVTVQTRQRSEDGDGFTSFPQIEVFTPNGECVGSRSPIECWGFIAEKRKADKRKRPRVRYRHK